MSVATEGSFSQQKKNKTASPELRKLLLAVACSSGELPGTLCTYKTVGFKGHCHSSIVLGIQVDVTEIKLNSVSLKKLSQQQQQKRISCFHAYRDFLKQRPICKNCSSAVKPVGSLSIKRRVY